MYEIWRSAVEATHGFVSAEHLEIISAQVRQEYLPGAVLHVAVDAEDHPLGFMGFADDTIESLFVEPGYHGRGVGRRLVEVASRADRPLRVDVNEQNLAARKFYERLGFKVIGRSELDGSGLPYPLLRLRAP